MKKKNLPVIAVAVVAVCLVAVAAALVIKAGGNSPGIQSDVTESIGNNYYYNTTDDRTPSSTIQAIISTTAQVFTDTFVPSSEQSKTDAPTQKPQQTNPTTVPSTQKQEEVTVPQLNEDDMSHAGANTGKAVSPGKDLPPDMSFYGLRKQGYDIIGKKDYIYNNDKDPDCMQKNFGYNKLYDAGASLIDFSIDTVRLEFAYGGKEWMIQLWKGQYISGKVGTVGGEIGVYTRPKGTISAIGHYSCAEEEDWLNMEMTVMWDEFGNGEYLPQLTRNYTEYWWATGFVDGQLANRNDSSPLRILGRITFKDEEMAVKFEEALVKKGFTRVSTFTPDVIDTYKRYGNDVIFLWQDVR